MHIMLIIEEKTMKNHLRLAKDASKGGAILKPP